MYQSLVLIGFYYVTSDEVKQQILAKIGKIRILEIWIRYSQMRGSCLWQTFVQRFESVNWV